ncbi:MAG: hypothetical protein JWM40_2426, partial [Frankiales bacterium]|nr:hypothetical protein [Frankiales bacterium]
MTFAPSLQPGWVRRNRGATALGIGLVLVIVVLAILTSGGKRGALDPDAYDPTGAHALSVLLGDS